MHGTTIAETQGSRASIFTLHCRGALFAPLFGSNVPLRGQDTAGTHRLDELTLPELLVNLVVFFAQLVDGPLMSPFHLFVVLSYFWVVFLRCRFRTVDSWLSTLTCGVGAGV